MLGATSDVDRIYLPYEVDAASESVYLIGGLPTGDMVHIRAYVRHNLLYAYPQHAMMC